MLLTLENICKDFGNPSDPAYRSVLKDLSFHVEENESVAVLGPSGSGKTTLLNLIGGLDYPTSGSVQFRGDNITAYSTSEMDRFRNESIGYVFQFHHLLPQCTLLENVLVPALVNRGKDDRKEKSNRAKELMSRVGIWDYRDQFPGKLSGGECQRAAVVRALINQPSILLADEPTGALDSENVSNMAGLLLDLNREQGIALVVVTHSIDLAKQMDSTLELRSGKLVKV